MEKNKTTIIEQFENKISFFSNNVFFGLLIIGSVRADH